MVGLAAYGWLPLLPGGGRPLHPSQSPSLSTSGGRRLRFEDSQSQTLVYFDVRHFVLFPFFILASAIKYTYWYLFPSISQISWSHWYLTLALKAPTIFFYPIPIKSEKWYPQNRNSLSPDISWQCKNPSLSISVFLSGVFFPSWNVVEDEECLIGRPIFFIPPNPKGLSDATLLKKWHTQIFSVIDP